MGCCCLVFDVDSLLLFRWCVLLVACCVACFVKFDIAVRVLFVVCRMLNYLFVLLCVV